MINRHQSQPVRTGAIASFPDLKSMAKGFNNVVSMLPASDPQEFLERYGVNNQPPNVINIALRIFREEDDMAETEWHKEIHSFVNDHADILTRRGIRRISILLCRRGTYPVYFTLRDFDGAWNEEQAIRNIEPALAFQLELSCLSNYNLWRLSKSTFTMPLPARTSWTTNSLFVP